MVQLQEIQGQLLEMGYQLLFVSPDRPEKVPTVAKDKAFDYTLLSDAEMKAALAFGIAFRVDDETLVKYKKFGIDLEEASGRKHHLLPVPAVFVFDGEGRVALSYADPDYRRRIAPEVLLAAAKAAK